MGTVFLIKMYGSNRSLMNTAAERALWEARRLDRMLSNYIPESELTRVNERAAKCPVKVSPEFFNLLSTCMNYSRQSEGTFDVTVGPLMKVWGFYKDSGRLPDPADVRTALENVGYQNVELDPAQETVRFKKSGVNLDPGGVGKGYAVDRMVDILRQNGIKSALISAGGSSIYGLGVPPSDARGWRIRIRDPKDEGGTAAEVFLKDESLSTSGTYEKFFWAQGRVYGHIMDPRTGYPAQDVLSVSIISPQTLDSEVWAKPYLILGHQWTARHKRKNFHVFMCEGRSQPSCAWLP